MAAPDARNCSQLCELLQAFGAVTSATSSLDNAMSLMALQQYHLILLGVGLGDWDAVSLVRAVRAGQPNGAVPIVGVAAEALRNKTEELLEAGANDVLTLPTSLRAAMQVLRHWCPDIEGTPVSGSPKDDMEAAKAVTEESAADTLFEPEDGEQAEARLKHLAHYRSQLQEVIGKLREAAGNANGPGSAGTEE